MNVLIVENEKPASDKVARLLRKIDKRIKVVGVVETVEGTINWLQDFPKPDLILMDIQLDDGLCFEIFETISLEIPVIFTTAYDEYTLKAFKVNSVDYLLKPIEEEALRLAVKKYKSVFVPQNEGTHDYQHMVGGLANTWKSRFLIKIGARYKSVPTSDISYFFIEERSVFLRTNDGKDYAIDYSLEKLQNILDPEVFFRINRACTVNLNSIAEMLSYSSNSFQLVLRNEDKKELFIVSRDKVTEFKKWVDR